jgi:hypothetical protein
MSGPNELEMRFQAEVFEQLERCGVDRTRVKIGYDDELQDDEITIKGPAEALGDEQYTAVAEAVLQNGYIITFSDQEARNRLWLAQKSLLVAQAQRWLAERGKLQGLPMFDAAKTDLATYARTLEAHLGFEPGSMLEVKDVPSLGQQQIVLKAWQTLPHNDLNPEHIETVVNAIAASNLEESGVITGVIGSTS